MALKRVPGLVLKTCAFVFVGCISRGLQKMCFAGRSRTAKFYGPSCAVLGSKKDMVYGPKFVAYSGLAGLFFSGCFNVAQATGCLDRGPKRRPRRGMVYKTKIHQTLVSGIPPCIGP